MKIALGVGAAAYILARRLRRTPFSLTGKTIMITGGSRGLGLALAQQCVRAGARVAILARDAAELDEARQRLAAIGANGAVQPEVIALPCDITSAGAVDAAVAEISTRLGPVDVLINNAGVIAVAPIENQSLEHFHDAMNTNFYGALHATLAVLPGMAKRRSGMIVNIASIGGLVAVPHLLPYSASKFALVGFSRGLNAELRSKGIHVLTVSPWLMRTGSHRHAKFGGKRHLEYAWFAIGATTPLVAVPAKRAALRIIQAMAACENELIISWWAKAVSFVAQVAPGVTAHALGLVNRGLPSGGPELSTVQVEGREVTGAAQAIPTVFGAAAAEKWNEA